jgi:prepilin-type N-terminal cleavage/methylation domain-containing protein
MSKNGFTLIELLIYLALLAFLSHLIFSFATQRAAQVGHDGKKVTQQAQVLMAVDLLVRDIRTAPASMKAWKKIAAQECIWYCTQKQKDLCWTVQKNCLVRIVGQYDEQAGIWKSKRREVAAQGVSQLLFHLVHEHNQVRVVCCTITLQGEQKPYVFKQWVTLRERIL